MPDKANSIPTPGQRPEGSAAPVSLRQVAAALGVSRMTVSRAFRPDAPVKTEMRERILEAARRLGYEPDVMVTEVMTSFAKRRPVKYRETLAVLWWPERRHGKGAAQGFYSGLDRGLHVCAARHGCTLEHIVLTRDLTGAALDRILRARNIQGVFLTPPPTAETPAPPLDWDRLSSVIIGSSLRDPRLHRVQAGHFNSMVRMLEMVRQRGYRRPALFVRPELDERNNRAYTAAFLAWDWGDPAAAARIWRPEADLSELAGWLRHAQPDCVIADSDALARLVPPLLPECGVASLDVGDPEGPLSGIYQNAFRVAESAIDLMMQVRLRHETGIPRDPYLLLTTGTWVEGRTLSDRPGAS